MGKRQHPVDYPQVPAPHADQSAYAQPQDPRDDTRFSWVQTPIDTERRRYTQNVQVQSTAPPLPTLPETWRPDTVRQIVPTDTHTNPARRQDTTINSRAREGDAPAVRAHDVKEEIQKPEPTRVIKRESSWLIPVGPDENPLSPSTASFASLPAPSTTNIATVSPNRNMTFATDNYAPVPHSTQGSSWKHSLCSCAEPTICMTGVFCPCILYGRVQYRLAMRSSKKDATNMLGYTAINGSCFAWALLCGVNGVLSGLQKSRIRRAYEMESGAGNYFSDCLEGCCCCCCVVAQNEKEIRHREEQGRRVNGGITNTQTGYIAPGGMVFSPPPRS